jgi:ribosomal protein S18 acetylase RimI-like enzyme
MQRLVQRIWSPACRYHVGDLAWEQNHRTGQNLPTRLWEEGGEVVAWGWFDSPGSLAVLVDPAWPKLTNEVLDWAAGVSPEFTITVLDAESQVIDALEQRGFTGQPGVNSYQSRSLDDLPEPSLPDGFRARPIEPSDLARRVAVHRAAWHPSKVTEDSYRDVMAAWPYRTDLDWVIEAPDGQFAAYCLTWLDSQNRVGELEPVGTAPAFRGRGLARAVCLAAMHALHHAGATAAVVYPVTFNHPATALYQSLGFREYARTLTYTSPANVVS